MKFVEHLILGGIADGRRMRLETGVISATIEGERYLALEIKAPAGNRMILIPAGSIPAEALARDSAKFLFPK